MKVAINRNSLVVLLVALLTALVFTVAHWSVMHDVVEICYTIDGPEGRSQVFWDSGEGFNEGNSRIIRDSAGPGPARLCFSSFRMREVDRMRIDPIDYPASFEISGVEVAYLDVVVPLRFVNRFELPQSGAVLGGMVALQGGQTRYDASGTDPMMTWSIPMKRVGGLQLVAISFCVLAAGILVMVLMACHGRSPGIFIPVLPVLLLYPFYLFFAVLSDVFGGFVRFSDYALWLALGVSFLIAATRGRQWSINKSVATVVATVIIFVIGFDVAFRLGAVEKPVFMTSGNQVYHWRLSQPTGQNLQHSSMRYYDDFGELADRLEPKAAFLTDTATSYYVSAATPLNATNVHMHHESAGFYRNLLENICGAQRETAEGVISDLSTENRSREVSGLEAIRYLIVNRDKLNRNVVDNCLQRNQAQILSVFDDRLRPVVSGKYIDAYEIILDL